MDRKNHTFKLKKLQELRRIYLEMAAKSTKLIKKEKTMDAASTYPKTTVYPSVGGHIASFMVEHF